MARFLHVKAGVIRNIVEYGAQTPPDVDETGADIVPEVTGQEFVGQAFDVSGAVKDRTIGAFPLAIFQELFRLTNAVRTLNAQAPLTPAQYKAFLKTLF